MRLKKISAGLLSAVILISAFSGTAAAIGTEGMITYTQEQIQEILISGEDSYSRYQEQQTAGNASADVPVDISSYSVNGNIPVIKKLDEFAGRTNVLALDDTADGNIGFGIEVPESGLYEIRFDYYALEGNTIDFEIGLQIDNKFPFSEIANMTLYRTWKSGEGIKTGKQGNEYNSTQEMSSCWMSDYARSNTGNGDYAFKIYFEKGAHTLGLYVYGEGFMLGGITLCAPRELPTYAEYAAGKAGSAPQGYSQDYEAEKYYAKSSRTLLPSSNKTSALNSPYSYSKIKLNVLGGGNWSQSGQWIEWEIEAPNDGFYALRMKYMQDYNKGLYSNRRLYVDSEIPFAEADRLQFGYSNEWQTYRITDDNGSELPLYLTAGKHIIRMEVVVGEIAGAIEKLEDVVYELNTMYRKMIMITSTTPDTYRDYNLDKEIPELSDVLRKSLDTLLEQYEVIRQASESKGELGSIINVMRYQLEKMISAPSKIPAQVSSFSTNIGSLSSWILDLKNQPLLFDYITVCSVDTKPARVQENFFEFIKREAVTFVNSFVQEYNVYNEADSEAPTIAVWVNTGRDQSQVIRAMLDDMFTPQTGIQVELKLVNASIIQAYLSGKAPDVSLMIGRGEPVNLAIRGALKDLTAFSDFNEVTKLFQPGATVPYTYNSGVYGLPDSQTFFMMFYRKDILKELGLKVPETWDDFYECLTVIEHNNMDVGIPYTGVDANGAVSSGMGSRNIFSALLLQSGGSFYNKALSATELESNAAMSAFEQWTAFYNEWGCPLTYNFYTRFRSGQMPLAIAAYTEYNRLQAAAPEIRNLWTMAPIPGVEDSTGNINIAQGGSGTACVMLNSTKYPDQAWEFIKWWVGNESMTRYTHDIEAAMGVAARFATANLSAMRNLGWKNADYQSLVTQWAAVQEIPEAPGGYYTVRGVDNAFRSVVNNGRNARESMKAWNLEINAEIKRKRVEFGIEDD